MDMRMVQEGRVVEVDDEDLVFGVGILDQRQRRGFHPGALVPHAAAVVDDQPYGNRNVFAVENFDRLRNAVFVNREGVLRQGGDQDRKSTRLNSSHANISYAV